MNRDITCLMPFSPAFLTVSAYLLTALITALYLCQVQHCCYYLLGITFSHMVLIVSTRFICVELINYWYCAKSSHVIVVLFGVTL